MEVSEEFLEELLRAINNQTKLLGAIASAVTSLAATQRTNAMQFNDEKFPDDKTLDAYEQFYKDTIETIQSDASDAIRNTIEGCMIANSHKSIHLD